MAQLQWKGVEACRFGYHTAAVRTAIMKNW